MGPTASGKTGVALELARQFPVEIVSVDSALVYRHMDIGTAKPDAATRLQVPHHLIDLVDPTERYSAAQFCADALLAMHEITGRNHIPLLTGGTMLYFKALREGLSDLPAADSATRLMIDAMAQDAGWPAMHRELQRMDPATAKRLDPHDAQRIQRAMEVFFLTGEPMSALLAQGSSRPLPFRLISLALTPGDRAVLHVRIAERFERMMKSGFLQEVRWLRDHFELHPDLPSMRCVGYRQAWQHLEGDLDLTGLKEKATAATRQLAKRQLTWLRATPDVREFDCLAADLSAQVGEWLEGQLAGEI